MTVEFDSVFTTLHTDNSIPDIHQQPHMLAVGCSHTYGTGISTEDCYTSVLSQQRKCPVVNLGLPGTNHFLCAVNIMQWVNRYSPTVVIAQWPSPVRLTVWQGHTGNLENINMHTTAFSELLKSGEENFYAPWIYSVISTNLLCRSLEIPIINILLEDNNHMYDQLAHYNISLHTDEKLPGQTWWFDSAAADGYHHSASCHQQWAERINGLINENTTR